MFISTGFGFYCPRCQFGECRLRQATYVRLHQNMVITAQDMPAYVCDVCGYHEFDYQAVKHLQTLSQATVKNNTSLSHQLANDRFTNETLPRKEVDLTSTPQNESD